MVGEHESNAALASRSFIKIYREKEQDKVEGLVGYE
jgi:hypothetical protein